MKSRAGSKILYVLALALWAGHSTGLAAQDARFGVALPFTVSGDLLDTSRARYDDPSAPQVSAAFRLLAMPEIKLGSHWYGYGAIQVRSTPYFYQDAYDTGHQVKYDTIQAYLGYSQNWSHTALVVKAGKLASAFGSFPLRYDDMLNPLIDQPLPYDYVLLQPSAAGAGNYGLSPVTLYGLLGAELDLSWRRVDSRFQLTSSNPYNPRQIGQSGQQPQWTAGGGVTIVQGFRVGMSAYRGPWLAGSFSHFIPAGRSASDYPSTGVGVDAQWARGRWSAGGEWDRFTWAFPFSSNAPPIKIGYAEVKMIINPRWYAATRLNYQTDGYSISNGVRSATTVFPNRQYYEFAVGFRPDRYQLIKVGYEIAHVDNGLLNRNNVFGIQLVTSFNGLSKALK